MILTKIIKLFKMSMKVHKPLVVILGATGTGKTKLSVEIASKYNGEVINGDAMQMYKGLDIITNKATKEECMGVPHHLLGVVEPYNRCTVIEYRDMALKAIENLHKRNKLPIVVGGCNYYLEAILFEIMSGYWEEEQSGGTKVGNFLQWCDYVKLSESLPNSEHSGLKEKLAVLLNSEDTPAIDIYEMLEQVDPKIASKYHYNDTRKIRRALEVWLKTGRKLSDIYHEQKTDAGGKDLGGMKRFDNVLILWLQCDRLTLRIRLKERIKDMVYRGLLEEVEQFHNHYNKHYLNDDVKYGKSGLPQHYQQGVFQCIGFKEFHDYLVLDQTKRDSKRGRKLFLQAMNLMEQRTVHYAKVQEKWIKHRLLVRDRLTYPVYGLDTKDPLQWDEIVSARMIDLMDAFLYGAKLPFDAEVVGEEEKLDHLLKVDVVQYPCKECKKMLQGKIQYDAHINGSKHKKILRQKRKEQEAAEFASQQETAVDKTEETSDPLEKAQVLDSSEKEKAMHS